MALGIGIILLWVLKILFYILIGIVYLIYMYFWPDFLVGLIIFIIYALSQKQTKKTIGKEGEQGTIRRYSINNNRL